MVRLNEFGLQVVVHVLCICGGCVLKLTAWLFACLFAMLLLPKLVNTLFSASFLQLRM